MLKRLLIIPGALVALFLVAFTNTSKPVTITTGTFGVCDCDEDTSMKFNLTISDDFTFHYYKNDDPDNMIDVKGKWEMKDNTIVLKEYTSSKPIHDKWTVDKNGVCLKSKKGLEWSRLCQVKPCN